MNNNQAIVLSIIIPVYKVEKYIQKCLDSIFLQGVDERSYEVIVVNDGTPDNSMAIVARFASEHANVAVINQENQGLSMARNTGLAHAKGDYIWFVDSDDWLTSDSIDYVLQVLQQNNFDIISSDLIYSHDDENLDWSVNRKHDAIITPEHYLTSYPVGAVQRYVIKKDFLILNNLQFYPGIYHEDAELAPRMIIKSKGVFMLSKHLYHYYQRENSIMSSWKLKNTLDYCFVAKRHHAIFKTVETTSLRRAFEYFTLIVYLNAFPKKQLISNPEIREVYQKEKGQIRKLAASLVASRLPLKKKIKVWLCFINPKFVIS